MALELFSSAPDCSKIFTLKCCIGSFVESGQSRAGDSLRRAMAAFDEKLRLFDQAMRNFQGMRFVFVRVRAEEILRELSAGERIEEKLGIVKLFPKRRDNFVGVFRHWETPPIEQRRRSAQHRLIRKTRRAFGVRSEEHT